MNAAYEYLFIGLLLVVIFGASVSMVQIMSVPLQDVSDRQTLQVTSEKILSQVLSSTGTPVNWGYSPSNPAPSYFGLAKQVETTRQTYELDINKVQRLNPADPYLLDANTVAKSLNLGRDYGFAIQVVPVFNIDVTRQGVSDSFTVTVTWQEDGLPVSNAKVTACMFAAEVSGPTPNYYVTEQLTTITGVDGKTLQPLDFGLVLAGKPMKLLIVVVDYLGLESTQVKTFGDWNTVPAYQVGGNILVSSSYQALPSSLRLYEALAIKDYKSPSPPEYNYTITSVSTGLTDRGTVSTSKGTFRNYAITNPEQSVAGFFVVQRSGVYYLAYTSKEIDFTFSTIPGLTIFPPGVRLQRLVTIDDTPYYAALYLWRMSQ